jgi:hypothetical protein
MPAKTYTGNGPWSTAANWNAGTVPVDNDSVTIASGQTITYDADMSNAGTWPNGLTGLVITGTLIVDTVADSYLKMKADITGVGTYNCGSSGTAYPAARMHTVDFGGGSFNFHMTGVSGTGAQLFCAQPATKQAWLSTAGASADTHVHVTGDVTAWPVGGYIRVDRVRKGDVQSVLKKINSITYADPVSTINLVAASADRGTAAVTADLGGTYEIGSVVSLCRRNIFVMNTTGYAFDGGTGWNIGAEIRGCSYGVIYGVSHTVSGTISGCTYGVIYGVSHTVSGTISGCTYGVIYGASHTVSGTISGCIYGVYVGASHTVSGTISGCTYGIGYGALHTVSGTISGCSCGVGYVMSLRGHGMTLTGNTIDVFYAAAENGPLALVRSFRHAGTANDVRAWSMGGSLTHDIDSVFVSASGKIYSRKFTYTSATSHCFMEWDIDAGTAGTLVIPCYAKHDASGLTAAQRLTFELFDPLSDPLATPAGTPLATWAVPDGTGVQTSLLTYARVDTRPLKLRVYATRASGNAWCLFDETACAAYPSPLTIGA